MMTFNYVQILSSFIFVILLSPTFCAAYVFLGGLTCDYFVGITTDMTQLGDRMIDNWALVTLFTFKNSSAPCSILWQPNYKYLDESISIGKCSIGVMKDTVNAKDYKFELRDYPSIPNLPTTCVIDIHAMMGTANACSGCNDPVTLYNNLAVRQFLDNKANNVEDVIAMYKQVALTTRIRLGSDYDNHVQQIKNLSNNNLVGIHIRTTDKIRHDDRISHEDQKWFTTARESEYIIKRIISFVREHLSKADSRKFFYLATDDNNDKFDAVVNAIEKDRPDIVIVNKDKNHRSPLADFFGLAACDVILQGVKYSSFSTAASLINDATLVSFAPIQNNNLLRWLPVLSLNLLHKDFSHHPLPE